LARCTIYNTQTFEHIESMHDKVGYMNLDTYREFSPQFQFCAILLLLLLLRSLIDALGILYVLLVSTIQKPLVSMTNLTRALSV
jgi:hypothetical protein